MILVLGCSIVSQARRRVKLKTLMMLDAFDVIAVLTLNQPLGFLDQGKDVNNMIKGLEVKMDDDALVHHLHQNSIKVFR